MTHCPWCNRPLTLPHALTGMAMEDRGAIAVRHECPLPKLLIADERWWAEIRGARGFDGAVKPKREPPRTPVRHRPPPPIYEGGHAV